MNYTFKIYFRIIFLLFITTNSYKVFSQDISRDNNGGKQGPEKKADSTEQVYFLKSKYFTFSNFLDTISYGDTILTEDFPYFNPLHALNYPVADKGYIGSSAMPLTGFVSKCGFNPGINGYDIYNFSKNNFQWHTNQVPFAQVFGSPSSIYTNFWVATKFSRNFKDINLDIDYKRINNTGKYSNQLAKHTDLNFGLWKGNLNNRFNSFFNIIVNIHEEEENGGVEDISFDPAFLKVTIPVKLDDAVSRIEKYELEFTEYIRINKNHSILGYKPYLKTEAGYHTGFYKFYDDNVSSDSMYYGVLLADPIGLRNYIKLDGFHTSVAFYGINKKRSNINTGIDYSRFTYTIESQDRNYINQLKIFGNARFNLYPRLSLDLDGQLYLGNFSSNYSLRTILNYTGSFISAELGSEIKNSSPSLMQKNLFMTGRKIYDNDFKNISSSEVYAGLTIKSLGLSTRLNYDIINSYIYFNEEKLAVQSPGKINLLQLNIEEKIRVWKFHFDNNIHLHKCSDLAIPVPQYVLRSKFYINTMLFKKVMNFNTGFELNYWDRYYNYGYNPAIGNYYVQNTVKLENFMRMDYFISARISDFMIFIRINNVLFPFKEKVHYTVLDYPHDDLFFRIGVNWNLLN